MHDWPVITLTTDFGYEGGYVAQMKGVIARLCPSATVIDVSHEIPPQDVAAAAWLLRDVVEAFPARTVHVVVVDPGVGSQRPILAMDTEVGFFVAPDNGLLTLIIRDFPPRQLVRLTESRYWREPVSATFHGRDIMSPVAAHIALGTPLAELGTASPTPQQLHLPPVTIHSHAVEGVIIRVDAFGNLITNIRRADCQGNRPHAVALCTPRGEPSFPWVRCYAEGAEGETVSLFGSSQRLEIAVVNGNAAMTLKAGVGDHVRARWKAGSAGSRST